MYVYDSRQHWQLEKKFKIHSTKSREIVVTPNMTYVICCVVHVQLYHLYYVHYSPTGIILTTYITAQPVGTSILTLETFWHSRSRPAEARPTVAHVAVPHKPRRGTTGHVRCSDVVRTLPRSRAAAGVGGGQAAPRTVRSAAGRSRKGPRNLAHGDEKGMPPAWPRRVAIQTPQEQGVGSIFGS